MILIAGGLFPVWKATTEIHHSMDVKTEEEKALGSVVMLSMSAAIVQILMLDLVFSIDSIITAVGMTEHLPIMVIAVISAVVVMLVAANPLAKFINDNPTVVMLALGFLIMIGMTLIAEGFGAHVPKGYIYAAMAFSAAVEALNMLVRRARRKESRYPGVHALIISEAVKRSTLATGSTFAFKARASTLRRADQLSAAHTAINQLAATAGALMCFASTAGCTARGSTLRG